MASSQFVSALALVAPFLPGGLRISFAASPPSVSYLEMTLGLLRELGVACEGRPPGEVGIGAGSRGSNRPGLFRFEYDVEPDASGATYFWAGAAVCPGSSCRVPGLNVWSLQSDVGFATTLGDAGAQVETEEDEISVRAPGGASLAPLSVNMHQMPDAAMTLAAACCFAPGRSVLSGLRTLRVKETDRLAALKNELVKVGVGVTVERDHDPAGGAPDERLVIDTPRAGIDCSPGVPRVEFDTYDDHRMAMSLALVGLRRPNVFIRNPACVAKTYPGFWRDLAGVYEAAPPNARKGDRR
jgi:3-phosphoshikimate 1-carboxyvinyltransferase